MESGVRGLPKRRSRGSEGGGYRGVAVTRRNLVDPGSSQATSPLWGLVRGGGVEPSS